MKERNELAADRGSEWPPERLDELLRAPHAAPSALTRRILEDLPPQSRWQRAFDWLTPLDGGGRWLRPAAVALVPLAFGFALGLGIREQGDDSLQDDVLLLAFTDSYFEAGAYEGDSDGRVPF